MSPLLRSTDELLLEKGGNPFKLDPFRYKQTANLCIWGNEGHRALMLWGLINQSKNAGHLVYVATATDELSAAVKRARYGVMPFEVEKRGARPLNQLLSVFASCLRVESDEFRKLIVVESGASLFRSPLHAEYDERYPVDNFLQDYRHYGISMVFGFENAADLPDNVSRALVTRCSHLVLTEEGEPPTLPACLKLRYPHSWRQYDAILIADHVAQGLLHSPAIAL